MDWRMQWVASTLHTTSEHGVSSITTADAHTSAASSRLNWRLPADLNGLVRFERKTKSGFCVCAITFQLASTYQRTWRHNPENKCIVVVSPAWQIPQSKREWKLYSREKTMACIEKLVTAVAQWLSCCARNRKVAGYIPAGVIGIFHWHRIIRIALWYWVRIILLTEMSTRSISWGVKPAGA